MELSSRIFEGFRAQGLEALGLQGFGVWGFRLSCELRLKRTRPRDAPERRVLKLSLDEKREVRRVRGNLAADCLVFSSNVERN